MRLSSCEKPIYIVQPKTHEVLRVSCGNCNSCCNERAKRWMTRLDTECQHHKYAFMFTLTYDDEWLPKLGFAEDDPDFLEFVNRDSDIRIPLQELIDLCKDEFGEYNEEELKYLRGRLTHPLCIPCVYTKDISNFIKRFNKYCFKHLTKHYENVRYFYAHEYGPTTYRIHGHGILFFDEDIIAQNFDAVLHACWKFGYSDGSQIYSDGGRGYVAQYVNAATHLPSFYSHSTLRQRVQFSKSPSIGTFELLDSSLREIYDRLPSRRFVWDSKTSGYVNLQIQDSFKNRYFPKCVGYRERSHFDRVQLYRSVEIVPSTDFEEFKGSFKDLEWLDFRRLANCEERVLIDYYKSLKREFEDPKSIDTALRRLYSLSKRIVLFSRSLHTSVDYLVKRIEEFNLKCDYERLVVFYQFQEDYAKVHSVRDLVFLYPELCYQIEHLFIKDDTFGNMPAYIRNALESFDIFYASEFPKLKMTFDFEQMKRNSEKIYKDSHKRNSINAYLYSDDFKYSDPKLQRLIINYKKYA